MEHDLLGDEKFPTLRILLALHFEQNPTLVQPIDPHSRLRDERFARLQALRSREKQVRKPILSRAVLLRFRCSVAKQSRSNFRDNISK